MAGCLILLAACLLPVPGLAQIKTTVADNLLGPDGSSASGTMTISAAGAFRSADGYNVAQGWRIQIPVVAGSFSVSLIPNQGATPTGQNDTYTVTYNLTSSLGSSYWTETWFVPSAGPVGLAAVRTLPAFPANFLSPQTANTVLAGPVSGSAGAASFRPLVCADLPGGCSGGDGGSMTWPTSAGIPNYSGSSSWGASYSATNLIPASIIPVLNQNTTGNAATATYATSAGSVPYSGLTGSVPTWNQNTSGTAALATALAATPTLCSPGYAPVGILANGNATGCALLGGGSVASVGLSLPSIFTVTGSPVTGSGTLAATLASQTANQFFASPTGSAGAPGFRSLAVADLPTLAFSNLSGSLAIGQTPLTSAGDILFANTTPVLARLGIGSTNQFLGISGGLPAWVQPSFSNVSGSLAGSQLPSGWNPVTLPNGGTGQTSFSAGLLRSNGTALSSAELSGDVTTSGSNTTLVGKVNGAAVPASASVLGSNASSQLVAVTSAPTCTKYTVAYNNSSLNVSSTTASVSLVTLGSRSAITGIFITTTTAFAGTSLTDGTVSIGPSTAGTCSVQATCYAPAYDLFATTGSTNFWIDGGMFIATTASHSIYANFTSVGGNLSALTAGSVDIDVCSLTLP